MKIEEKSALLVIDIQQEDFVEMNESNMDAPEWECKIGRASCRERV
nr:hypothetical protein [uncultured Acetatifactor sp.]